MKENDGFLNNRLQLIKHPNEELKNLVGFFDVLIRIDKRLQEEKQKKEGQRD